MRYSEEDIPKALGYFVADTGDATHGYAGSIDDEREYRRVREHYTKVDSVERLLIGHYELVRVEEVLLDA